jgi:hypothetical protein
MRSRFFGVLLFAAALLLPVALTAQVTWQVGDVFVGVGNQYQIWRNTGSGYTMIDSIPFSSGQAGGCGFDSQFNFYGTNGISTSPISGQIVEFNNAAHSVGGATVAFSYPTSTAYPESIVFDASGDFYVGSPNSSVLRYTPNFPASPDIGPGAVAISYTAQTPIGTTSAADQVDLGTDQANLFLTSSTASSKPAVQANTVTRVDLSNSSNVSTAANISGSTLWSVRLIPTADIKPGTPPTPIRGMLVAADNSVLQLSGAGSVVKTFQATKSLKFKSVRFLAMDPDGVSFWAGDYGNGNVLKFNLSSGAVTASFSTGSTNALGGVCVKGGQQLNVVPLQYSPTVLSQTAPFGDPKIDPSTLQPGIDTSQTPPQFASTDYHTWTGVFTSITSPFTMVISTTGQGAVPSSVQAGMPLLDRFDEYFPCQAEPGNCSFTGPTLVPIPYTDQAASQNGIPTVSGTGTIAAVQPHRAVYRVENPPPSTSYSDVNIIIRFRQPPICQPTTGTVVSPFPTPPTTTNSAICYEPPQCGSNANGPLYVNNPRFLRDPSLPPPSDASANHQFAFDSTADYLLDTGIRSSGGSTNDHVVADRCPSIGSGATCDFATATINSPLPKSSINIGSNLPVKVTVTDCNGNAVTNAITSPNNMTVSVTGPNGQIELATAQSYPVFTQNGGAGGTYAAVIQTDTWQPGTTTLCITSTSTQSGSGQFTPACTSFTAR